MNIKLRYLLWALLPFFVLPVFFMSQTACTDNIGTFVETAVPDTSHHDTIPADTVPTDTVPADTPE